MKRPRMQDVVQAGQGLGVVLMVVGGLYTGVVQLPGLADRVSVESRETRTQTASEAAKAVRDTLRDELKPIRRKLDKNADELRSQRHALDDLVRRVGRVEAAAELPAAATTATTPARGAP